MGKATREAYGNALAKIGKENSNIIVLDADLSKSGRQNENHYGNKGQHT